MAICRARTKNARFLGGENRASDNRPPRGLRVRGGQIYEAVLGWHQARFLG